MANISEVKESIALVKQSYQKWLALGEKAKGDDFRMEIEGYPELSMLIHATQLPEVKREPTEDYGPHGVKFQQQGRLINAGDITFTSMETVTGKALEALRDLVKNKKYVTIRIGCPSESVPDGAAPLTVEMEDCWIEMDPADLSREDNATLKPAGTIHYGWPSYFNVEETSPMGWE